MPSQLLLQPAAIDLSAEEKQALLENQPLLENAGLDVADFGGSTVLLRAVPADVEPQNAEDLLVGNRRRLAQGQPGRAERAHRVGAALHLLPRRHQGGG